MRRRHFTLQEALALLPRLTELLSALRAQRRALLEKERALVDHYHRRVRSNGQARGGEELARLQAEVEAGRRALAEAAATVEALGCELKDVEQGLIDFPALRQGREIYLCWRLGEPTIAWWHEVDTGFAGRRPLEPL